MIGKLHDAGLKSEHAYLAGFADGQPPSAWRPGRRGPVKTQRGCLATANPDS